MTKLASQPIGAHLALWGEGPLWHHDRLLYVDIEGHKVLSLNPTTGEETIWDVGERVGTVVPRAEGGLVFAGDKGFSFLNEETGEVTPIVNPEAHIPTNRFNDGKCDPAGRFWAGTMDLRSPRQAVGALYCLDKDLTLQTKFHGVACSNGIVWTRDTLTMYYIDTPRKNVLAFDFDPETGAISKERVAFETKVFTGNPDGMTIDSQDRLWIAFCHAGVIRCFDPLSGHCLDEVHVPVREVTACAFGGPDLRDLYITTGKEEGVELAGRVFVAQPGVDGVPAYTFKG